MNDPILVLSPAALERLWIEAKRRELDDRLRAIEERITAALGRERDEGTR